MESGEENSTVNALNTVRHAFTVISCKLLTTTRGKNPNFQVFSHGLQRSRLHKLIDINWESDRTQV